LPFTFYNTKQCETGSRREIARPSTKQPDLYHKSTVNYFHTRTVVICCYSARKLIFVIIVSCTEGRHCSESVKPVNKRAGRWKCN